MQGRYVYFGCVMVGVLVLNAAASASDVAASPAHQARIKDIASIEGIRDNQLVGYGIVVGLQGTGDSQQTTFPTQTLAATLPLFARPGTKLDVTTSSAGDARSLEGGLLLMTPLYGADGKIYAQAQGPLVVGGYSVSVNGDGEE